MYFLRKNDPGLCWAPWCGLLSSRAGSCDGSFCVNRQRKPMWAQVRELSTGTTGRELCSAVSQSLAEQLAFSSCIFPVSACALLCFSHQGPQLGSCPFSGAPSLPGNECTERRGLRFPQRFWMWFRCPRVVRSCSLYLLMHFRGLFQGSLRKNKTASSFALISPSIRLQWLAPFLKFL